MWTEERLNKMLTTPSEALSVELGRLEGDILVLGAGGKMGPTLCVLAKNALRAAGVEKRVIAVSRFSDPLVVELLRENGVEVLEMPSSELSRGRGGPRCMSMPLWREDL